MAEAGVGTASTAADGSLLAVIGDEDTVTGFLLAGVGHVDLRRQSNFFIVTDKTPVAKIEQAFLEYTQQRKDVGVVLITQRAASEVRHLVEAHSAAVPALLEIPSSDAPYSAEADSVFQRVKTLFGGEISGLEAAGGGGGAAR